MSQAAAARKVNKANRGAEEVNTAYPGCTQLYPRIMAFNFEANLYNNCTTLHTYGLHLKPPGSVVFSPPQHRPGAQSINYFLWVARQRTTLYQHLGKQFPLSIQIHALFITVVVTLVSMYYSCFMRVQIDIYAVGRRHTYIVLYHNGRNIYFYEQRSNGTRRRRCCQFDECTIKHYISHLIRKLTSCHRI